MKIPFEPTPDLNFYFMSLTTNQVEWVGDDRLWLVRATVENGDFNKENRNHIQLKLLEQNAEMDAIAYGGLAVFSNVKKSVIRKALLFGLEYLMRTGQLSKDDFTVAKRKQEGQ